MAEHPRFGRAALLLATATLTVACTTPRAAPPVSQAVLDARANRDSPPPAACPDTPLADISPTLAPFSFGESALSQTGRLALDQRLPWLTCHPAVPVVIKPDADVHGTAAEQDTLASQRATAVEAYLTGHGVAAQRIRVLPRGAKAPPVNQQVLIQAEGARW